jgi:hydroxypyruvate isomerase
MTQPFGTKVRLAANLSTSFQEFPFDQRAAEAAARGFSGIEVQFPYDTAVADWVRVVGESGLPLVLLNAPKGADGHPGLAALPDRRPEFVAGIARAAEYAAALSCPLVHVLAGIGGDRDCYLDNLALAAEMLRPAGATVVIEVLNQVDVPDYHLRSTADALSVIARVPGVGLQHDLYHSARNGEDVPAVLQAMTEPPTHLQVSSCPDRHEPDEATIAGMKRAIELGYQSFIGCEYWPATTTLAGLSWAAPFGIA